jgi:hypothetical protein
MMSLGDGWTAAGKRVPSMHERSRSVSDFAGLISRRSARRQVSTQEAHKTGPGQPTRLNATRRAANPTVSTHHPTEDQALA